MPHPSAPAPGRVSATAERPPARTAYDIVVLGGGLLGAVVAERLRSLAPERSLLLVEAGGLPNEDGATIAAPGLVPPIADGPGGSMEGARAAAGAGGATAGSAAAAGASGPDALAWARAWSRAVLAAAGVGGGAARPADRRGWVALAAGAEAPPVAEGAPPGAGPAGALDTRAGSPASGPLRTLLPADSVQAVVALTGVAPDRPGRMLDGGWLSAEELALTLARRAVRSGADLALNARARPQDPERLVLERLGADRRMRVGVHARHEVTARTVVVACGAGGAAVAEEALDRPVRLPSAYLQFPRVRLDAGLGAAALPVVSLAGWVWRPGPGGALLVPPPLPPDPEGYEPGGGRMLGVPVGLRRELLDALLAAPELGPLLASGRLELGKSVRAVRGARFSVPPGGLPVAERLGEGWWLLAGGTQGLTHDVAAAAALAAAVAGTPPPWHG